MNYFDIREERQEIHSLKVNWFLRWGIMVVFIIIVIIIWLSSIIQYPDIIKGEATLTSSNPPATIRALSTIQIDDIFIEDNSVVEKGDYLLKYTNTANLDHVSSLKNRLLKFTTNRDSLLHLYKVLGNKQYNLGDIQESYYDFIGVLYTHYYYYGLMHDSLKIEELQKQRDIQLDLLSHYQNIREMKTNEFHLMRTREQVDSSLFQKGVIDRFSYHASLINKIGTQSTIEQISISHDNILYQISKISEIITNLKLEREEKILQLNSNILHTYNNLLRAIYLWEEKYTIKAPISGKVAFLNFIKEKNMVSSGDKLFTIIPAENYYKVQLKLPFEKAQEIELGQLVKVKLSNIPYREYGYLSCVIERISQAANEDHYLALAIPENRLITTYNKKIEYKENMKGIGEVVINDRSILGRMLEKIIYVFKN